MKPMRYFPLFLDLDAKTVLVLGGGAAATNKLRLFSKTNAALKCVAEEFSDGIEEMIATGRINAIKGTPETAPFDDASIIIAATESDADAVIVRRANAAKILVNAVDKTDLCDFITPSFADRGTVVVAIGTEGAAPVLARRLREQVEIMLPQNLGALSRFIGENRERVARVHPTTPLRRALWEEVIDGPIGQLVLSGHADQATDALTARLDTAATAAPSPPRQQITLMVSPATADDLTIKALRALQNADALYAEDGVPDEVLDRARRDAERIRLTLPPDLHPDAVGRLVYILQPTSSKRDVLTLKLWLEGQGACVATTAIVSPAEDRTLVTDV